MVVAPVRIVRVGPTVLNLSSIAYKVSDETTLESDTHADTCCLGEGALEILDHEEPVNVQGYDSTLGSKQYRTISGALAYDNPHSGKRYHVIIHQAVSIPTMKHHLLCPMQSRANGVTVNDCPRMYVENPDEESHCIVANDEDGNKVLLPFLLRGVTSYLSVTTLGKQEFDSHEYPRVHLTSCDLRWDPGSDIYAQQENAMIDHRGIVLRRDSTARGPMTVINQITTSTCDDAVDFTANENFGAVLASHINISELHNSTTRYGDIKSNKRKQVDSTTLAKRWGIDPKKAMRTVRKTTQRGVRTTLHPTLSRRYPTKDRMKRYRRMPHPLFTDTLFAGTTSKDGNKCSQVFGSSFGWSRSNAMKSKGQAHDALGLMFKRDGVPPKIVSDGAKEEILGRFAEKCREADCHLVQTEPYSPWQLAAEGTVKQLKHASSRQMLRSGSPKRLWDYSMELAALVRSHIAHDVYMLEGEVPETMMTGQTADISNLCEYEWYEWVMFRDALASYPDDPLTLGKYLGPAIDVGSAMTYRILKANGQVVCRTTVRPLTAAEEVCAAVTARKRAFTDSIDAALGPAPSTDDFLPDDLTPEYEPFEDPMVEDGLEGTADELPPTPEMYDSYLNVQIELP